MGYLKAPNKTLRFNRKDEIILNDLSELGLLDIGIKKKFINYYAFILQPVKEKFMKEYYKNFMNEQGLIDLLNLLPVYVRINNNIILDLWKFIKLFNEIKANLITYDLENIIKGVAMTEKFDFNAKYIKYILRELNLNEE